MAVKLVATPTAVVAFDPGYTTGWAKVDLDTGVAKFGEIVGRYQVYAWLSLLVATGEKVQIVAERYTINAETHKKSAQLDALNILGYLDALCFCEGWSALELQTPAAGKAFGTNEKLRAVDWWHPTQGGHANDAARHLLLFVTTHHRGPGELGARLLGKIVRTLDL